MRSQLMAQTHPSAAVKVCLNTVMDKGNKVSLERDSEVRKAPHTAARSRPWIGVWLPQENIPAVAFLETRSSLSVPTQGFLKSACASYNHFSDMFWIIFISSLQADKDISHWYFEYFKSGNKEDMP